MILKMYVFNINNFNVYFLNQRDHISFKATIPKTELMTVCVRSKDI